MPALDPGNRIELHAGADPGASGCAEATHGGGWIWPLSAMRRETFAKGDYLFRVGDRADKLFYINHGSIRLPEINRLIRAGQVIGEMGIFSPGRERTASALCEEDVEAFTMGREEVVHLFTLNPSLAMELMQLSNKRFI